MTLSEVLQPIEHAAAHIGDGDVITLAFQRGSIKGGGAITREAAESLWKQLGGVLGMVPGKRVVKLQVVAKGKAA